MGWRVRLPPSGTAVSGDSPALQSKGSGCFPTTDGQGPSSSAPHALPASSCLSCPNCPAQSPALRWKHHGTHRRFHLCKTTAVPKLAHACGSQTTGKRIHRENTIQQSAESVLALCSCYKMVRPFRRPLLRGAGGGRRPSRQGFTEEQSALPVLKGSG